MTDPRSHPDPANVTHQTPAQIAVPVSDLRRSPAGQRDRQLVFGEAVTHLGTRDGACLIRAAKDGYHGWVASDHLTAPTAATHSVTARGTHVYARADMKSPDLMSLSFGSQITATDETATFIETAQGFVPRQHVHRSGTRATDPAAIAALFLGTPYLWGGNTQLGIDCSGLVQAALLACGMDCPGDSDQQARDLGTPLPTGAALKRNDLIFWKGHVALVTDADTLIHANAGHMAVVYENIAAARTRIETQGDGPPTAMKRL